MCSVVERARQRRLHSTTKTSAASVTSFPFDFSVFFHLFLRVPEAGRQLGAEEQGQGQSKGRRESRSSSGRGWCGEK